MNMGKGYSKVHKKADLGDRLFYIFLEMINL